MHLLTTNIRTMKKLAVVLITLILASSISTAQNTAKLQSIFIYNFIKLIEWPASYKSGTFNITVLGNDQIYTELMNLAKVKKAGSQTIKVKKINSLGELANPHILYIPKTKGSKVSDAKTSIGSKATLLISDTNNGTGKGSDINFVVVGNKPKFEIKTSSAQSKGLKISSNLVNLGIKK